MERCSSAASSMPRRRTSCRRWPSTSSSTACRCPWRAGPRSSSVRRFTIAPERIRDGRVVFDRDESRHLARVLRLRSGDTVLASDGVGREYTELGVARIVPVLTARTIVTLDSARWRDRARRWQRVAKEAAKQCGRAVVPPVDVPRPLGEALDLAVDAIGLRLCLWEEVADGAAGGQGGGQARLLGTPLAASLPPALPAGSHIFLLIGPEGGLASDEVEAARDRGWTIVGLGPRILRTETAGPAIIAVLQARFGDLGRTD